VHEDEFFSAVVRSCLLIFTDCPESRFLLRLGRGLGMQDRLGSPVLVLTWQVAVNGCRLRLNSRRTFPNFPICPSSFPIVLVEGRADADFIHLQLPLLLLDLGSGIKNPRSPAIRIHCKPPRTLSLAGRSGSSHHRKWLGIQGFLLCFAGRSFLGCDSLVPWSAHLHLKVNLG